MSEKPKFVGCIGCYFAGARSFVCEKEDHKSCREVAMTSSYGPPIPCRCSCHGGPQHECENTRRGLGDQVQEIVRKVQEK